MLTLSRKKMGTVVSWRWDLVLSLAGPCGCSSFGHTLTMRKIVLPLNPRRRINGQDLACSHWRSWVLSFPRQVCVPTQQIFPVCLQVVTPPRRSGMRRVTSFVALLAFFRCSCTERFWFKTVDAISLQALHFYEGGNGKDNCYSCSWICLLSLLLSALQSYLIYIRGYLGHFYLERENNGNLIWDLYQFR